MSELTPAENRRRIARLRAEAIGGKGSNAAGNRKGGEASKGKRGFARKDGPACPECGLEPAVRGGRCFTCRARSMQQ